MKKRGQNDLITIERKSDCCGCNACGDICPKQAISFVTDEEGFWYPQIDFAKCVDCGLCENVCPMLHVDELKKNDLPESICYAAEHKDLEVVFDSTSGGLFSALAEYTYQQHGFVGGAVFNEDLSVSQFISADEKDLVRLRSSKYLQSGAEGFYREVRRLAQAGYLWYTLPDGSYALFFRKRIRESYYRRFYLPRCQFSEDLAEVFAVF